MNRKARIAVVFALIAVAVSACTGYWLLASRQKNTGIDEWKAWAEVAWRYYTPGVGVDPETLLHRANMFWHRFTDWDLGSYIQSLLDAKRIGLLKQEAEFTERINRILQFLDRRELSDNGIPYWSYSSNNGQPNKEAGETTPPDVGRLLISLSNLRTYRPELAQRIERIVEKQGTQKLLARKGLEGGFYGHFAAHGFKAFRIDQDGKVARSLEEMSRLSKGKFVEIFGEQIPLAWITSEPVLHALLELPSQDALFQEYARRIYKTQEKRFQTSGKYTAFSEGAYFAHGNYVFEWIIRGDTGATWTVTRIDGGKVQTLDIAPVIYTKAALGFHAVFPSDYTKKLVSWLLSRTDIMTGNGFVEGVSEANELVSDTTDKTNAMIISAARFAIESKTRSAELLPADAVFEDSDHLVGVSIPSHVGAQIFLASSNKVFAQILRCKQIPRSFSEARDFRVSDQA